MSRHTPTNVVGGIYNSTPPVFADQQFVAFQFDSSGNLLTTGGGSGSNASVNPVGTPVPGSATMIGWDDGSGNTQFVSAANPLPIAGSITASNPSVGTTGTTAPTSATLLGVVAAGNLQPVSATYPVRVDPTGTTTQPVSFGALPAGTNLIGQVEVSDGTNVLFTSGHPGYVQGTVAVTNFANPLPTIGNSATQQTATWTSSTTMNTAITASVVGYSTVLVTLAQTGNCLGLGVAFEVSDTVAGTNWYTLYGIEDQTGNIPVSSYAAGTNTTAHSFLINVAGWNQFRLRVYSTTVQSGDLVAAFTPQTASCTQFVGVVNAVTLGAGNALIGGVKLSDGTNTMGTMTGFGTTPTGSANALVTNASIFQGTAAISATNPLVTEIGDGTHTVTLNSTTYSSKYGLDVNILGTLGTAFTTAGFVDIKGADGNVFVRQATAANLNATVVGTGTFAVQAAQTGTWTVGLTSGTGPIKIEGNAGGAFDAATNAAPPANAVQIGCIAATALPSANTATDLTVPMTDKFGRQVVLPQAMRDLVDYIGTTITSTTSATNILTAISGVYTDICSLTITNSSSTATLLTLSDGTRSLVFSAAAGPGWGITIPFSPPIPATNLNTNWTLACGTSVASIYVVVGYVKNK